MSQFIFLLVIIKVYNFITLTDFLQGRKLTMCQNHVHYAQGVAVDPFGSLIASLSADRTLKFYTETKKKKERFKCVHTSV